MYLSDQIEEIMSEFDFHKVQKVMHVLDWNYYDSDTPPSIDTLKCTARQLLSNCADLDNNTTSIQTGGFEARLDKEYYDDEDKFYYALSLKFVVEQMTSLIASRMSLEA